MPSPTATPLSTRAIVGALSDRRSSDRISAGDRRAVLRMTYVADASGRPIPDHRLVFAIGRHVGNAVTRNRCRRRVRAAFDQLVTQRHVPAGAYLFRPTARVAEMGYPDLLMSLEKLLDDLMSTLNVGGTS